MNHIGLLIIRIGLGIIFLIHGTPKLTHPERWESLGMAMQNFGIYFWPKFWGFMAAFAETFGALCLISGILWKPGLVLLSSTMFVAVFYHIGKGQGLNYYSHPLSLLIVFAGLFLVGPGKYRPNKSTN